MPGLGPEGGTSVPLGSIAANRLERDEFKFPNWYAMLRASTWSIGIDRASASGIMTMTMIIRMNLKHDVNFMLNEGDRDKGV